MIAGTSYEFITQNVWNKPKLFQRSFKDVKGYVLLLRSFDDLNHLSFFLWSGLEGTGEICRRLVRELRQLGHKMPKLRNAILEILLFVHRDEIIPPEIYWDEPDEFERRFHCNLMRYVFEDMKEAGTTNKHEEDNANFTDEY